MEAIGIGVAIAVLSAAIIGGGRWLLSETNRETGREFLKQRTCRHQWEEIPGDVITADREWCVKCNARRS